MNEARPPVIVRKVVTVAPPRKASPWELAFRATIVTALVISVGLAWWTFQMRLVPLQQKSRDLTLSISKLSDQVESLQRKCSKDDIQQIRSEFKQLHTYLFANEAELRAWI